MRKINHLRNEKGVALITVVMIFLVLVIMLGGAMYAAVVNQRNAILANEHTESYYVAESGINLRIAQLEDFLLNPDLYVGYDPRVTTMQDYLGSIVADLNTTRILTLGNGNTADVYVTGPIENPDLLGAYVYKIRSTGTVDDVSRTLEVELILYMTYGEDSPMDKAIISRGSIIMYQGNGIIKGGVFTNGEGLPIRYQGKTVTGPILELGDKDELNNTTLLPLKNGDGYCDNIVGMAWPVAFPPTVLELHKNQTGPGTCLDNTPRTNEPLRIFPPVVTPAFPTRLKTVTMDANNVITLPDLRKEPTSYDGYYIDTLNISANVTIKLGSFGYSTQLKRLVVGNITTTSQGRLNVEGTGRLMVMRSMTKANTPSNSLQWNANVYVQGNNPAKFILVLDTPEAAIPSTNAAGSVNTGSDDPSFNPLFSFANGVIFTGSILSENVDYALTNVIFKGYLITNGGDISVTSNTVASEPDIPIWIYAPIAHVTLGSNAVLYGSVMSKAVELSAASSGVIYKDMPPSTQVFNYLFYAPPETGGGTAPNLPLVYYSNIVEVDND
jgi:hypothetical protein